MPETLACRHTTARHYPKYVSQLPPKFFPPTETSANREPVITGLTGAWAFSLFGFLSAAMIPIPFLLFKYGPGFRARSKHYEQKMMGKQVAESADADLEKQSSGEETEGGMMSAESAEGSRLESTTKHPAGGRNEGIFASS